MPHGFGENHNPYNMYSCSAVHTVMLIRNFLYAKKKEILNIASSAHYTEHLLSLHTCIDRGSIYLGRASQTAMYSLMINDNILNKATLRNQRTTTRSYKVVNMLNA